VATVPGIFISYRRDDTEAYAGRLADDLRRHFGDDDVFIDIQTLQPGADFVEEIEAAVGSADVVLVVIGRQWLSATDDRGRRRLDDPHDFVRLEVSAALGRSIRVIPVLVHGASMPSKEELPEALAALVRRNAFEIDNRRWRYDVQRLIVVLDEQIHRRRPERPPEGANPDRRPQSPMPVVTSSNARAVGYLIAAGWLIGVAVGESGGYIERPFIWPFRFAASWWLGGALAALVTVLAVAGHNRDWRRLLWIALAAGVCAELIDGVSWTGVRLPLDNLLGSQAPEGVRLVVGGALKLLNAMICAAIVGLAAIAASGRRRPVGRTTLSLVVGAALGILGETVLKVPVGSLSILDPLRRDRLRLLTWIAAGVVLVWWQLASSKTRNATTPPDARAPQSI
jgi:hypothetical protein